MKKRMTNFFVDAAGTGAATGVAMYYAHKSSHKKLLRVIALIVGLTVFVRLPVVFASSDNVGDKAVGAVSSFGRGMLSFLVFIIGLVVLAVSK